MTRAAVGATFSPLAPANSRARRRRRRTTRRPIIFARRSTSRVAAPSPRARASNDDDDDEGTFRLVMLRHAASSWAETEVKDADRPLTEAGRASASATARNVAGRGWMPDLTLCSNSRRSRETVEVMRATDEGFGRAERTSYLGSLYHFASLDGQLRHHLNECVLERTTTRDEDAGAEGESVGVEEGLACEYVADARTIMVVGHNKGMEEAASEYCGEDVRLQVATAAILERARGGPDETWEQAMEDAGGWTLVAIASPDGVLDTL